MAAGADRVEIGEGPSGLACLLREAVVVEDLSADPRMTTWPWRDDAADHGCRAAVALPLTVGAAVVGTLNVYRARSGRWSDEQLRVLTFFAEHAAGAIRSAQLLDHRRHQLEATRHLVRVLREQTHEHANRLHALAGLLALGETRDAQQLLDVLESEHVAIRESLDARVQVPTIAGLVLAQAAVAARRGIAFGLSPDSWVPSLPSALTESQVVTILGNLLDNAFDAVAEVAEPRRQVVLRVHDDGHRLAIEAERDGDTTRFRVSVPR